MKPDLRDASVGDEKESKLDWLSSILKSNSIVKPSKPRLNQL